MKKIITAINEPTLNKELKEEGSIKVVGRDIQYKEGILEILEFDSNFDYIIIDFNLPGEIKINELIENILEKKENIKILITINKENNLNIFEQEFEDLFGEENVEKIFYKNIINLNKIKKYISFNNNNDENYILKENTENKKYKIITFYGESRVGKTSIILNLALLLIEQKYKILIIELNENNQDLNIILKNNKKLKHISYNNITEYKIEKIIENNYDYILVENYLINNKVLNKKIINISDINILIIRPNILGIKNSKIILENNKKIKNNLKIIINKKTKYSISEDILKNIFYNNKIIGNLYFDELFEKNLNEEYLYWNKMSREKKKKVEEVFKKIK